MSRPGWLVGSVLGVAVLSGCLLRSPGPPLPLLPAGEAGGRRDAVLQPAVSEEDAGENLAFAGDRWRLRVPRASGWRRDAEAGSTLRLTREADGVTAVLRLRIYAVRRGMEPRTFLAAHAMWLAEEGAPRVEYAWDEDLQAWQGYAVGSSSETYYVFKIAEDRAYVVEEAAEAGALGARAADEFQRIAAQFECGPAAASTETP